MPDDAETVAGWDFDAGRDLDGLLGSMLRTGFQATSLGRAIAEVNRMVRHETALLLACIQPCITSVCMQLVKHYIFGWPFADRLAIER